MTQHLNTTEEGILLRLISKQFYDEKPLPIDENQLYKSLKKIRITTMEDIDIAMELLDEFFVKTNDGYINELYEGKLREIIRNSKTAKERGKKGGRPRKNDLEGAENTKVIEKNSKKLNKKLSPCLSNENNNLTNHEKQPINNKQETINNKQEGKGNDINPLSHKTGFKQFIASYPKRVGVDQYKMRKAAEEWELNNLDKHFFKIMKSVADRSKFSNWREKINTDQEKYIPDPLTFLKGRVFEQEFERVLSFDEKLEIEKKQLEEDYKNGKFS